jgi:hypothetical protein
MSDKDKLKAAFQLISSVNKVAYRDLFLLSNQVLSKNFYSNNFIKNFIADEQPGHQGTLIICYKLIVYYYKNMILFSLYLFGFIAFFFSGVKRFAAEKYEKLIVIDVFLLMKQIIKAKTYKDPYFPGLDDILLKLKKNYAYLPVFDSSRNPFALFKTLRILKKDNVPVLCEYQLLSFFDIIWLFYFIVAYPFRVLAFAIKLPMEDDGKGLLRSELINTLNHSVFNAFSRYLQGRKIACLKCGEIKLLSWYENQTTDKNLYKGIRHNPQKITIYGAQLFLYSKSMLNITVDENESEFGVVPDKIIVNGRYYVPEKPGNNFIVGPSLRYAKLFSTIINKIHQRNILVLLPYFPDKAGNILKLLTRARLPHDSVIIKAHPALRLSMLKKMNTGDYKVVDDDLYRLFQTAKVVVSADSGTLVEACSLGIHAIVVTREKTISCNPLPDLGKGVIWDEVATEEELRETIRRMDQLRHERGNEMDSLAREYREMFFGDCKEESVIRAFDL